LRALRFQNSHFTPPTLLHSTTCSLLADAHVRHTHVLEIH